MANKLFVIEILCMLLFPSITAERTRAHCVYENHYSRDGMVIGKCVGNVLDGLNLPFNGTQRIVHLKLSNSNLTEIHDSAFLDVPGLKTLELDHNQIIFISRKALWNLTQLEHLDLSFNNLSYSDFARDIFKYQFQSLRSLKLTNHWPQNMYPKAALHNLSTLEELHINGMEVDVFPRDIAHLPSLSILNLQIPHYRTGSRTITQQYLTHLRTSGIEELSMQSNGIRDISPGCFQNFSNLKTLNLAQNRNLEFKHVTGVLSELGSTPLETLILDGISSAYSDTLLDTITFCNEMGAGLKKLSIKYCSITKADYRVFKCFTNLTVLSIGFNQPFGWINGSPTESESSLKFLPKTLQALDISHMYEQRNGHFYDVYNTNKDILPSDFYFEKPLGKLLQYTSDNQSNLWNKTSSHFKPPKEKFRLLHIPPNLEAVNFDYCGLDGELQPFALNEDNGLKAASLVGNEKTRTQKAYFPWYNMEKLIYIDLTRTNLYLSKDSLATAETLYPRLRIFNVSWNNLGAQAELLPNLFRTMPNVEHLELTHNGITYLPENTFEGCLHLKLLNLAENKLTNTLDFTMVSLTNLKILNISFNSMDSLSHSVRDGLNDLLDSSNITVDLHGNPLSCSCVGLESIRWVQQQSTVSLHSGEKLTCDSENSSQPILSIRLDKLEERCQNPRALNVLVQALVGTGTISTLSIIFGVLIYRKRWFLQWHYYKIQRLLRTTNSDKLVSDETGGKLFDAFVIYSIESDGDTHVVAQIMRRNLEKDGRFGLFIKGRDDVGGTSKADEIIRAIEQSEKSILLVTPDFVLDEWCIFSLHMVIENGDISNRLCILLQDDVDIPTMPKILLKLAGPNSGVHLIAHDGQVWHEENCAKQMLLFEQISNFIGQKEMVDCL